MISLYSLLNQRYSVKISNSNEVFAKPSRHHLASGERIVICKRLSSITGTKTHPSHDNFDIPMPVQYIIQISLDFIESMSMIMWLL